MSRRNFIQRILLQLLVMCFGPKILELVDWEEFGKTVDQLACRPVLGTDNWTKVYKARYPNGLKEILYEAESNFLQMLKRGSLKTGA